MRPELHQPHGILHGGVHCSVVETVASIGAGLWLGERGRVVGVNNSTDFLRATHDGALTSTATPVHRGRSQQLWLVETVDDDGRLVARGQVRLHNLYPRLLTRRTGDLLSRTWARRSRSRLLTVPPRPT